MNPKDKGTRNALDRQFWLIILTSWDMENVEILEEYAQNCERSTQW